ncbi:hypothetical protein CY0110_18402 [Crocosphaera chwakensis CCY0110]|uniref:Uncharacterized protein n=1 Tax=Crocosphaera chwakensis CCY0110 TaxID=391612 RepID=A3IJ12_9CHRO|nr:hypothetical protein CY0110_18402 [Crocosphaera chwakensis CCY0110]
MALVVPFNSIEDTPTAIALKAIVIKGN